MNFLPFLTRQSSSVLDVLQRAEEGCEGACATRWKIIFAAILFVQSLIFAHLVYLLKFFKSINTSKVRGFLHLLNTFSGGIFLATGLLHIFPESIAIYEGEHNHGEEGHDDHDDHDDHDEHDEHEGEHDHDEHGHDDHDHRAEDGHGHGEEEEEHGFPWVFFAFMMSFYLFFFIERILLPRILKSPDACDIDAETAEEGRHLHGEDTPKDDKDELDVFRSGKPGLFSTDFAVGLLQILGISAHSLFESMALGLAVQLSTSTNIFIATVLHRGFTALAIAVRIIDKLNYIGFLVLLTLFSLVVPLGVGIGFAVSSIGSAVQGILFSVSAGTFLYVGAYEVPAEEFGGKNKSPLLKFGFMMLGVAVISVVTGILVATGVHH